MDGSHLAGGGIGWPGSRRHGADEQRGGGHLPRRQELRRMQMMLHQAPVSGRTRSCPSRPPPSAGAGGAATAAQEPKSPTRCNLRAACTFVRASKRLLTAVHAEHSGETPTRWAVRGSDRPQRLCSGSRDCCHSRRFRSQACSSGNNAPDLAVPTTFQRRIESPARSARFICSNHETWAAPGGDVNCQAAGIEWCSTSNTSMANRMRATCCGKCVQPCLPFAAALARTSAVSLADSHNTGKSRSSSAKPLPGVFHAAPHPPPSHLQ